MTVEKVGNVQLGQELVMDLVRAGLDGRLGPVPPTHRVQQLNLFHASGGTFTLSFAGETTEPITRTIDSEMPGRVTDALQGLSAMSAYSISAVQQYAGTIITFTAWPEVTQIPDLTIDITELIDDGQGLSASWIRSEPPEPTTATLGDLDALSAQIYTSLGYLAQQIADGAGGGGGGFSAPENYTYHSLALGSPGSGTLLTHQESNPNNTDLHVVEIGDVHMPFKKTGLFRITGDVGGIFWNGGADRPALGDILELRVRTSPDASGKNRPLSRQFVVTEAILAQEFPRVLDFADTVLIPDLDPANYLFSVEMIPVVGAWTPNMRLSMNITFEMLAAI